MDFIDQNSKEYSDFLKANKQKKIDEVVGLFDVKCLDSDFKIHDIIDKKFADKILKMKKCGYEKIIMHKGSPTHKKDIMAHPNATYLKPTTKIDRNIKNFCTTRSMYDIERCDKLNGKEIKLLIRELKKIFAEKAPCLFEIKEFNEGCVSKDLVKWLPWIDDTTRICFWDNEEDIKMTIESNGRDIFSSLPKLNDESVGFFLKSGIQNEIRKLITRNHNFIAHTILRLMCVPHLKTHDDEYKTQDFESPPLTTETKDVIVSNYYVETKFSHQDHCDQIRNNFSIKFKDHHSKRNKIVFINKMCKNLSLDDLEGCVTNEKFYSDEIKGTGRKIGYSKRFHPIIYKKIMYVCVTKKFFLDHPLNPPPCSPFIPCDIDLEYLERNRHQSKRIVKFGNCYKFLCGRSGSVVEKTDNVRRDLRTEKEIQKIIKNVVKNVEIDEYILWFSVEFDNMVR